MTKNKLHKNKKYFKSKQVGRVQFHVKTRIAENLHKHCISLWIASRGKFIDVHRPHDGFKAMELLSEIPHTTRSGTLTFVKTSNRYFGITCDHVLKELDKKNKDFFKEHNIEDEIDYSPYSLTTVLNKTVQFDSLEFLQPVPQYPDDAPDIRIVELTQELIESQLSKKAIDLDKFNDTPDDLSFAIALGFPEKLKKIKKDEKGFSRVTMPHTTVLAELDGTPTGRINMCSIVYQKVERNFSGMSGGPIFWTRKNKYNLLGIVFESPNQNYDTFDEYTIHIRGELATPDLVKTWIGNLFGGDKKI